MAGRSAFFIISIVSSCFLFIVTFPATLVNVSPTTIFGFDSAAKLPGVTTEIILPLSRLGGWL